MQVVNPLTEEVTFGFKAYRNIDPFSQLFYNSEHCFMLQVFGLRFEINETTSEAHTEVSVSRSHLVAASTGPGAIDSADKPLELQRKFERRTTAPLKFTFTAETAIPLFDQD